MRAHAYDIFISYRREGGESAAQTIYDRLTESGYHVFLDRESLNSGNFDTRIYAVIDQCRDFLLILSPEALTRCKNGDDWVRREVEYALMKEKNIIPIMMKGFSFPDELPASMEALPSKNGILLNYDFFEAFLAKLEDFLKSSPDLFHSIRRNRLLRKAMPLFAALLLAMAVGAAGRQIYLYINSNYPFTNAEKNLTSDYIAYISKNLQQINQAAGILSDVYDECAYYYQSPGSLSAQEVLTELDTAIYRLTQMDASENALSAEMKASLSDSPFDSAEAEALNGLAVDYVSESIDNLYFMKKIINGDIILSEHDAAGVVAAYAEFNEQELLSLGYGANEALLPVTNEKALAVFKQDILPLLQELTGASGQWQWSGSKEELVAAQNACYEKMQSLTIGIASVTGNLNVEVSQEKEALIEQYMALGMTREEAEARLDSLTDKSNQLTMSRQELEAAQQELEEAKAEVRRKFAPSLEDDVGTLWGKMLRFLNVRMYDEALNCVDYIRETQRDVDEYSPAYTAACASFIRSISQTGIDYGLMVTGYDPENISPYYEIGDVIISYNGSVVHNYTEYEAAKASGSGTENAVIVVMRRNSQDVWENVSLELPPDAPGVYLTNMTEKQYD